MTIREMGKDKPHRGAALPAYRCRTREDAEHLRVTVCQRVEGGPGERVLWEDRYRVTGWEGDSMELFTLGDALAHLDERHQERRAG